MNPLSKRFFDAAESFWQTADQVKAHLGAIVDGPPDVADRLTEAHQAHEKARAGLLQAGEALATRMVEKGLDATPLLRFLALAEDPRPENSPREGWPEAKAAVKAAGLGGKSIAKPELSSVSKAKSSSRDLAEKHKINHEALRKRLERWRFEHDSGYIEVSNPRRNEPRYLYDETAVMPVIEDVRKNETRRRTNSSIERPAKK